MSALYDVFFAADKKPALGTGNKQAIAVVDIRDATGKIVRWHALCNQDQYTYHLKNAGKELSADLASSAKTVDGKHVSLHRFLGRDVVDTVAKLRYTDKGPVSTEAVAPTPDKEK